MENSIKTHGFCGIISAAAIVMAAVSLIVSLGIKSGVGLPTDGAVNVVDTEEVVDAAAISVTNGAKYSARIENGYVVVRDAAGDLVKTFETPVKFMTNADREYFEHGADIYSDEELAALTDDFGG